MTTTEEIAIRLGIDSKAVTKGLTSLKSKIAEFAKSTAGQFVQAFGGAALLNHIKNVINSVEALQNRAESLSVSTAFLQDIQNVGIAAGKSAKEMEKVLTMFEKTLQPGQDLETEFRKFIDALDGTKDPATRAKMAFDVLGKSAMAALDVFKGGSKVFDEAAGSLMKLTDAEQANIMMLDAQLDRTENFLKVIAGKAISAWADFWSAVGRAQGTPMKGNSYGALGHLTDSYMKNVAESKQAAITAQAKKDQLAAENKIVAARQIALLSAQQEFDLQRMLLKMLEDKKKALGEMQERKAEQLRGLSDVPIGDLRDQSEEMFGKPAQLEFTKEQKQTLADADRLGRKSQQARIYGWGKLADDLQKARSDKLKGLKFLSEADRDPLGAMNKSLADIKSDIADLLTASKGMGLNVSITDVKMK